MVLSKDQPISDAFSVICPFGSFFLTKTGGLIGAIELGGCDPDALTQQDAINLSMLSRVVYGALPANFTVNEYYLQAARAPITLRDRSDPLSHRLSQARQAALRERGLARSKIVHVLHARDPQGWNGELVSTVLKNLPFFFLSRESRRIVKARLRTPNALVLREAELSARSAALKKALSDAAAKWSLAMTSRVLPLEELWKFLRFCATLDSRFVDPNSPVPVPDDDADCALQAGDIEPVRLGYEDALKLYGQETRYLRIASLYKMPKNPVGLFARQPDPLISRRGSFVLQNQYSPVTEFQRSFKFKGARTRIDRTMLDLRALFLGYEPTHPGEQRLKVRQKIEELERAEAVAESWATSFCQLIVFDEDPARLKKTVSTFDNLLTTKGVSLVWEAPALPMAFQAFQPGGEGHSIRNSTVTTSRAAALSLVYRAQSGIETVEALGGEEPQYFFETETGELFCFSAHIGGRALIIVVGPIRTGKTFAKNTMTAHFLKYGGMSRSIDIDPGTETLAKLFGEDGGLFRVGDGVVRGLNPFVAAGGPDDRAFAAHMSALALQLLEVNDTESGRSFTASEQAEFDRALQSVLRLPPEMQNLPHLIDHFPGHLQKKFGRWVGDGTYAGIFDAAEDGIGALNKRVGVFNLQAFRDDPKVLKPLLLEIFYRVTAEFEGQANRRLPKLLEIDEAHHALALPGFRDFIVRKVRTWGKFGAGITLWSQSANDYLRTPDWDAIRGAATTFMFFADPRMDAALYKEAFHLNDGQCEAIRNLVPKRELFLVQPEIGVAKKLILTVEPEQYVVNTSDPHEAALRDELIAQHGFEEGLRLAVEQIHRVNHLMAAE